jgi:anti-anti-sigma factor
MTIQITRRDDVIAIEGEMTIYFGTEMKQQLLAALHADTRDVVLDLARVTELDTCGLQMLLMVRVVAAAAERVFTVHAPSAAVADVLRLCGLNEWFGNQTTEAA